MASPRVLLWFRNDLRVHDNELLTLAAKAVQSRSAEAAQLPHSGLFYSPNVTQRISVSQVLPVYCFDPRHFAISEYDSPKTGYHRAKFLHESVCDLKRGTAPLYPT
jgi:deoxyribodipyrimidine photo-lyase